MNQITSHVLDTSLGKPAEGIEISLRQLVDGELRVLGAAITNADGRIANFDTGASAKTDPLDQGLYQLHFALDPYFESTGRESFYPDVVITFKVAGDGQHYHVPLLLNPFGYSTYRGS